jgi:hypothetical protein
MKMKVTFKNEEYMILEQKEINKIFTQEQKEKLIIEPIKYVRKATVRNNNAAFKTLVAALNSKFEDTYEELNLI